MIEFGDVERVSLAMPEPNDVDPNDTEAMNAFVFESTGREMDSGGVLHGLQRVAGTEDAAGIFAGILIGLMLADDQPSGNR